MNRPPRGSTLVVGGPPQPAWGWGRPPRRGIAMNVVRKHLLVLSSLATTCLYLVALAGPASAHPVVINDTFEPIAPAPEQHWWTSAPVVAVLALLVAGAVVVTLVRLVRRVPRRSTPQQPVPQA